MDFVQRAKATLEDGVGAITQPRSSRSTPLIFPAHGLEEQQQSTSSLHLEASNQQISS